MLKKLWHRIKDDELIKNILINDSDIDGRTFFILFLFKTVLLGFLFRGFVLNPLFLALLSFIFYFPLIRSRIASINKNRIVLSVILTYIITEYIYRTFTATTYLLSLYLPKDLFSHSSYIYDSIWGQLIEISILSNQIAIISLFFLTLIILLVLSLKKEKKEIVKNNLFPVSKSKLIDFKAELTRYDYLLCTIKLSLFYSIGTVIIMLLVLLFSGAGFNISSYSYVNMTPYYLLSITLSLFLIISYVSIVIRRIRNIGISAAWAFLFIPLIMLGSFATIPYINTLFIRSASMLGSEFMMVYSIHISPMVTLMLSNCSFIGIFGFTILLLFPKKKAA